MAVYTEKWPISYALNTITELELTTTQNVQNNYTTVSYVVRVKRLKLANGNGNDNDNWTPSSGGSYTTLVIDGKTILNSHRSNWTTLSNNPEETAIVASGSTNVYHNANGTKNIAFSLTLRPNVSSISTMPNRVITGNFDATTIPRASSFTLADTLTSGSNYTMTITRASTAFTHKVARVIGGVEVAINNNASTSATINIPHSVFNSYPSSSSITATIIVRTFSGSTQIGSASKTVKVNLTSSAIPTVTGLSVSNSNSGPMSRNQFIRGISRLTLTASSDNGSYSSTISSYEFRYKRASGTYQGGVSTTSKSYQYAPFAFPNSGSEVLSVAVRVKDSRGRYSAWKETASAIRVHYYQAPTIGSITVRRVGSNNTTLQVTRNYVVTSLLEGGSTQKNKASLKFQTKVLGGANPTNFNTGATSTTMTLTNSNANLSGTFSASSSYEVRAVLSDAVNTVYGSWVTVGTEFVPLDFSSKGIGIGKIHSNGARDLEVGAGGINSEGQIRENGVVVSEGRHSNYKTFTVGGNANSYYPVIITSQAQFGFHRYSISRGYNWAAPDTWNNSTHRGGLTLDFEWSGDTLWGGNDKTVRVIEWNETYTTMVGGLRLARTGGLIVWLRGGGAQYRLSSERGMYAGVEVKLSGFTDGSGENFPVRTSPVVSEINNKYPIRGDGWLYDSGNKVWNAGNDGSGSGLDADLLDGLHASSFMRSNVSVPTITSGTNDNGNWYNINGVLLICWHRYSITGKLTNSQMNGTWTYPMPFAYAPAVSIGSRADDDTNSTNSYRRAGSTAFHQYNESTTKTDILYAVNNGDVPNNPRKYINIFAIGTPA